MLVKYFFIKSVVVTDYAFLLYSWISCYFTSFTNKNDLFLAFFAPLREIFFIEFNSLINPFLPDFP